MSERQQHGTLEDTEELARCVECGFRAMSVSISTTEPTPQFTRHELVEYTTEAGYTTVSVKCGRCGYFDAEEMSKESFLADVGKLYFGFKDE